MNKREQQIKPYNKKSIFFARKVKIQRAQPGRRVVVTYTGNIKNDRKIPWTSRYYTQTVQNPEAAHFMVEETAQRWKQTKFRQNKGMGCNGQQTSQNAQKVCKRTQEYKLIKIRHDLQVESRGIEPKQGHTQSHRAPIVLGVIVWFKKCRTTCHHCADLALV